MLSNPQILSFFKLTILLISDHCAAVVVTKVSGPEEEGVPEDHHVDQSTGNNPLLILRQTH